MKAAQYTHYVARHKYRYRGHRAEAYADPVASFYLHSSGALGARKFGLAAFLAIAWALLCLSSAGWQAGQTIPDALLEPEAGDTQYLLSAAPLTQLRAASPLEDHDQDDSAPPSTVASPRLDPLATTAFQSAQTYAARSPFALFQARAPPQYS